MHEEEPIVIIRRKRRSFLAEAEAAEPPKPVSVPVQCGVQIAEEETARGDTRPTAPTEPTVPGGAAAPPYLADSPAVENVAAESQAAKPVEVRAGRANSAKRKAKQSEKAPES